MKKTVCITRKIPEVGTRMLMKKYQVVFPEVGVFKKNEFIQRIGDCHALLTLLSDRIDEEILSSFPSLKIVANYAVGYNNIDVAAAIKHNIMVTNTPGVLTNATAEIAFALMISLTRQILRADRFTRDGKFSGWDPLLFLGDELSGKTIGIIGMGRIGRSMAEKCRAFGLKIIYHNRNPLSNGVEKALSAEYRSMEHLLQESDIISVHTPLTDDTFHLLDEKAFGQMKEGVYLINTARGEVVHEKVLVKALKNGKVKGAGFDVYEFEPKISKELMKLENVVLLPHIGSATIETRNRMSEMAARNIISALSGEVPENLVPELKKTKTGQ